MKRINVRIDTETNDIVTKAAKRAGTSKRNIFSFAIVFIKDKSSMFSCTDIGNMNNAMSMDYLTSISISDEINAHFADLSKEDTCYMGKNRYFGVLINYFFNTYRYEFLPEDENEGEYNASDVKDISFSINGTLKENLQTLIKERGIDLNGLFGYYIMNHDIVKKSIQEKGYRLESDEKEQEDTYHLRLHKNAKDELEKQASNYNMTKTFYLLVLSRAIYDDLTKQNG